jgi:hypothetical protein
MLSTMRGLQPEPLLARPFQAAVSSRRLRQECRRNRYSDMQKEIKTATGGIDRKTPLANGAPEVQRLRREESKNPGAVREMRLLLDPGEECRCSNNPGQ